MDDADLRFALGPERMDRLENAEKVVMAAREQSLDAETVEVTLMAQTGRDAVSMLRSIEAGDESWVMVQGRNDDGQIRVWAVDEPSAEGRRRPVEALVYPELHTRMVAWWIVHSWRFTDLASETAEAIRHWEINTAAVLARALIEEVTCLRYEAVALLEGWALSKQSRPKTSADVNAIRQVLHPVLASASFGSRIKRRHPDFVATNVLTYVQKASRATGVKEWEDLYDLLSDAAHPAWGARIAMASQPAKHVSGSHFVRFYARRPVSVINSRGMGLDFTIAHAAADALDLSIELGRNVLDVSLQMVDDFGLTTAAAELSERDYWRKLHPVRGSRACPCGRGKWSKCQHWWGAAAPGLSNE